METVLSQLDRAFRSAIRAAFDLDADPLLGVAQNEAFGDYQANVAMGLAKQIAERIGRKTNPRAVAEQIIAKLELGELALGVSVAGPGFINVRLSPQWLADRLRAIGDDQRVGVDPVEAPQTVVVDYSGPNIAKEMHVGHVRSTIIGDAVSRVLDFQGHHVIRQNHIGDWGTQFGRVVLAVWYEAVFERSGNAAALHALIQRQQAAGRELAAAKEAGNERAGGEAFAGAIAAIVRDIAPLHHRFIAEDPDGDKYFLPYLQGNDLRLDELERAYVFVSALTDSPEAKKVVLEHPLHGPRTLAELPRLTTTFIQHPDDPRNWQEKLAWEKARTVTLDACGEIYRRLGVELADPRVQAEPMVRGESYYNPFLPDVVRELKEKGLAVVSDGATVVPVQGYETPLIIEKAGGGYLYGTTDLAAIRFRTATLHADRIVYFVDARQGQHFAQVFDTARRAGWADHAALEHAAFGTMLGKDGKPFKTRSGDTVKLKDLIDEAEERAGGIVAGKRPDLPPRQLQSVAHSVGVGGLKYGDLSKDRTSDYVFSFDAMLALEGNTAPYMQYAYARVRSVFRKAAERGVTFAGTAATPIRLESPHEIALAKQVLRFGEVVHLVGRELKPHHLCAYLFELATRFSGFFENCPIVQSDEPVRASRLALAELTARTIARGLDLLGIEHPEQM